MPTIKMISLLHTPRTIAYTSIATKAANNVLDMIQAARIADMVAESLRGAK